MKTEAKTPSMYSAMRMFDDVAVVRPSRVAEFAPTRTQRSLGYLNATFGVAAALTVGAVLTTLFDTAQGFFGSLFSQHRGKYFQNFCIIAPIQKSVFLMTSFTILTGVNVIAQRVCLFVLPTLLITPKVLLGVAIAVSLVCLPKIYQAARASAEEFSSKDFSIFFRDNFPLPIFYPIRPTLISGPNRPSEPHRYMPIAGKVLIIDGKRVLLPETRETPELVEIPFDVPVNLGTVIFEKPI